MEPEPQSHWGAVHVLSRCNLYRSTEEKDYAFEHGRAKEMLPSS